MLSHKAYVYLSHVIWLFFVCYNDDLKDPIKDNLKNCYEIDAEYCDMTALIDSLSNCESVDIASEIYKGTENAYYAVITYKGYKPSRKKVIAALNAYEQIEEYDIYANYEYVAPKK